MTYVFRLLGHANSVLTGSAQVFKKNIKTNSASYDSSLSALVITFKGYLGVCINVRTILVKTILYAVHIALDGTRS